MYKKAIKKSNLDIKKKKPVGRPPKKLKSKKTTITKGTKQSIKKPSMKKTKKEIPKKQKSIKKPPTKNPVKNPVKKPSKKQPKTVKKVITQSKSKIIKQKGGENIGIIAGDVFKSFYNLGKEVFNEINSLTKLPQELNLMPSTKVTTKPTPPVVYNTPPVAEQEEMMS